MKNPIVIVVQYHPADCYICGGCCQQYCHRLCQTYHHRCVHIIIIDSGGCNVVDNGDNDIRRLCSASIVIIHTGGNGHFVSSVCVPWRLIGEIRPNQGTEVLPIYEQQGGLDGSNGANSVNMRTSMSMMSSRLKYHGL
jgi:hypothetical protein